MGCGVVATNRRTENVVVVVPITRSDQEPPLGSMYTSSVYASLEGVHDPRRTLTLKFPVRGRVLERGPLSDANWPVTKPS